MVQWKMAGHLKGNDPIGDTPIFQFHDYGRKGILHLFSARESQALNLYHDGILGGEIQGVRAESFGIQENDRNCTWAKQVNQNIKTYQVGIPQIH